MATAIYSCIACCLFMVLQLFQADHLLIATKLYIIGDSVLQSPIVACLYNPYKLSLLASSSGVFDELINLQAISNSYDNYSGSIYPTRSKE